MATLGMDNRRAKALTFQVWKTRTNGSECAQLLTIHRNIPAKCHSERSEESAADVRSFHESISNFVTITPHSTFAVWGTK